MPSNADAAMLTVCPTERKGKETASLKQQTALSVTLISFITANHCMKNQQKSLPTAYVIGVAGRLGNSCIVPLYVTVAGEQLRCPLICQYCWGKHNCTELFAFIAEFFLTLIGLPC